MANHLVFFGEHELSIDEKNRMLVPSDVRKRMDSNTHGEAFFVIYGLGGRPWLYPEKSYESLVSRPPTQLIPDEDALAYDRMSLGMASRIEWDKQGRVLFPDKFLKRSGIGKEVTLVGVRDHLELWNRSDWEAERQRLLNSMGEVTMRAKQFKESPQPTSPSTSPQSGS